MATIPNLPPGLEAKYTKQNNALVRHVRTDAREKLHVAVGDLATPNEFIPKLVLAAWEESEFAIQIPKLPGAQCSWEGEKLVYGNNTYLCKFYELADGSGYEYEVHFLKKPGNNSWAFNVEMTDVKAWYQPPLTVEELAELDDEGNPAFNRPDNVVGSYALYKESPVANKDTGKLYRVGKVGHLFRPYIEDANGSRVWCDMVLDEQAMTLTVTIPPSFFNTAPLPWVLDPTFGYNTAGGSTISLEGMISSWQGTMSEDGTPTQFNLYSNPGTSNLHFSGAFYSDASTMNLIQGGNEMTPANPNTAAWRTVSFSSWPSLTNGQSLHLCAWGNSTSGTHYAYYDNTGQTVATRVSTAGFPTWPSTVTRGTNTYRFSIYIDYTASGGGGGATNPGWAGGGCW